MKPWEILMYLTFNKLVKQGMRDAQSASKAYSNYPFTLFSIMFFFQLCSFYIWTTDLVNKLKETTKCNLPTEMLAIIKRESFDSEKLTKFWVPALLSADYATRVNLANCESFEARSDYLFTGKRTLINQETPGKKSWMEMTNNLNWNCTYLQSVLFLQQINKIIHPSKTKLTWHVKLLTTL